MVHNCIDLMAPLFWAMSGLSVTLVWEYEQLLLDKTQAIRVRVCVGEAGLLMYKVRAAGLRSSEST